MKTKYYTIVLAVIVLTITVSVGQVDSIKHVRDSVQVKPLLAKAEERKPEWYDHKAWPWIASLIVGVITVGINLYISLAARRTSLKVVDKQIETSMHVAQKQVESSFNLAKAQFQLSLNSKNRQDWINELRDCISEFSTHARQLNIHYQLEDRGSEKAFSLQEKVYLYRSKIRLLLTPSIEKHSNYLSAQESLMNVLEIHLLNSKANIKQFNNQDFMVKSDIMIEMGRELLYFEWQKVQNAQFDAS